MQHRTRWLIAAGAAALAAAFALPRLRSKRFDDAVVLITGGSRGLGLALAQEFARRGARLALFARDADELERARARLAEYTNDVIVIAGDVRDEGDARHAIERTLSEFQRIDVLVNDSDSVRVSAEAARLGIRVTTVTRRPMRIGRPRQSYAARRIVDATALGKASISVGQTTACEGRAGVDYGKGKSEAAPDEVVAFEVSGMPALTNSR